MPIEVDCTNCQRRLRLPDRAAGKKIRCPKCRGIVEAPAQGGVTWYMKTDEGDQYGPVPKSELDEWFAEGRIDAQCQLLAEGERQWKWASDVYPQLANGASHGPAAPLPSAVAPQAIPVDSAPGPIIDTGGRSSLGQKKSTGPTIVTFNAFSAITNPASGGVGVHGWDENGNFRSRDADFGGKQARPGESKCSRLVAGVLALVVGWCGAHRFYMGYSGIGVLILLSTCFLGAGQIWAFIEGIMILTGQFKYDARGLPLRD